MIIFRYLAKDVFLTLVALTSILLLIFMSNQCVLYLNRAATGQIPGMFIMKLMMLEMPNLIGLLLPLGFYMAILLVYSRMYAESEMTALFAGGYSPNRLLIHSLMMAGGVAFIVAVLVLWVGPWIAIERIRLLKTTGVQTMIQTIVPGRFRSLQDGQVVFYVESMAKNHRKAHHIFLAKHIQTQDKWDVVWANQAFAKTDPKTKEDYLVLENGRAYMGVPGHADYQLLRFETYEARLPHPEVKAEQDIRTAKTGYLLPFYLSDREKTAELQWRASVPLMVLVLTFVVVPLSRVPPRAGQYAKLLPAVLIYLLYANFMFVARDWVINGKIPMSIGMFWMHLFVIGVGCLLLWWNRRQLA